MSCRSIDGDRPCCEIADERNLDLIERGEATVSDVGRPCRVMPQSLEDGLQQLGFDACFPLAEPRLIVEIAVVLVWEHRLETESKPEILLFTYHRPSIYTAGIRRRRMPIFEYVCRECHHRFDLIVNGSTVPQCPSCRTDKLDKQLSAFAVGGTGYAGSPASGPCGSCGDPRGPGACSM